MRTAEPLKFGNDRGIEYSRQRAPVNFRDGLSAREKPVKRRQSSGGKRLAADPARFGDQCNFLDAPPIRPRAKMFESESASISQ